MKYLKILFTAFFIAGLLVFVRPILAQDPGSPPPPPASHGGSGNAEGAPIGGGLFILLGMAGVYGGIKGYKLYREKKKETTE